MMDIIISYEWCFVYTFKMYFKNYKSNKCGHMQSITIRTAYVEFTLKHGHTTNFRTIHQSENKM